MIRSEKKVRDLALLLERDNYLLISEAIGLLREEQSFEGAIGLLTAFYDRTDNHPVKRIIENFMNDLKDPSTRAEVITELRKAWNPDTISMLVSSCWQSGLDYSEYSLDLTNIFLSCDYVTAIECLTVMEETVKNLTRKKKDEIIKIIEESTPSPINEKRTLNYEMLSILRR
jgi:hypothetical protein